VLIPLAVLVLLAVIAWPLAIVLLPFLLWAGLAPVLARRGVDRLGTDAREALGQLGAHLTETIQGLAELTAFQAVARRRAVFSADIDAYRKNRGTCRSKAPPSKQRAASVALLLPRSVDGCACKAGSRVKPCRCSCWLRLPRSCR
jgi:ABC-type transport system involved in cytochrome bd biosynthesis fused ATPase/permease subunit